MGKKVLFVVLVWLVAAVVVFIIYLCREITPVKEIITWAIGIGPLLAILGAVPLAISGWILKHDFGRSKANYRGNQGIEQVVDELKTIRIIDGRSGNITRILYHDREKLAVGLSNYETSVQDKLVLAQLNLRKIVKLEQRRTASGPRQYDEGFWVLTELGKEVILYLEKNKQILDYRGKVGQEPFDTEQSLILTIQEYAIGLSGMTDYPKKPENAAWLRLKVAVNPISKPIDTLDIIIGSETIHVNNWPRKIVATFTAYFKVTEWQWKGEHQVELIAKVGGKSYSFGRTLIDFNIEPGGRGHLI